ncbi:MAG: hypothetical protein ABIP93_15555 [Gemmatimonadaceae bacterium]
MISRIAPAVQGARRIGYWGVRLPLNDFRRRLAGGARPLLSATLLVPLLLRPCTLSAQEPAPGAAAADSVRSVRREAHYWRSVAAGFATSLLAHEGAHVATSLAVGGRPSFGFDRGRPTVYSGLDVKTEPGKQFLFSSMGLNVQALLDEGILDAPHRSRGAPFERGILAGGIATALFYVTIGRTASVSDVDFMARTSSLSKSEISLIYGGVALMHTLRIHRDGRYANFFVRPMPAGQRGLRVGVHAQ